MRSSLFGENVERTDDAPAGMSLQNPRLLKNMVFTGSGRLVLSAYGTPVVLDAAEAPTFADLQSAVAWSSSLRTSLVRSAGAGALVGRGSGEAFQLAFAGQGFVVVQASEGPVVPKHQHSGGTAGGATGGLFS